MNTEQKVKDICEAYLHYCVNTNGVNLYDQWVATLEGEKLINELQRMGGMSQIYPIEKRPQIKDPDGDGWSIDIVLISGDKKFLGYFDPKGSIAGGRYFYYQPDVCDCSLLNEYPTHWYYLPTHSQSQGDEKKEEVQLYTRGQMYEIANRFYGSDYNMTEETFDNYMSHIHHYRQNQ